MSDDILPEDMSRWPEEPFALFGVGAADDERTVRLAYTRLIRRFKPERFPEHFRRLREAYETVRARLQWRWRAEAEQTDEAADEPLAAGPPTPTTSGVPDEPGDALRAAPVPSLEPVTYFNRPAELEAAWRMAQDGAPREAYQRLQAVRRRFGPHRDISIREYWLLKVEPQVDAGRNRLEPLAEALALDRLSGPAVELYRRECERSPEEALGERFSTLLAASVDADPAALADVLQWRWLAAGKLRRWRVIAEDVERFRRRIADDERTWAQLLLAALDQLAWYLDEGALAFFKQVEREVDALRHVHFDLSNELDRLDLLIDVAGGWRKLQQVLTTNAKLAAIIWRSWSQSVADYRRDCAEVIRSLVADPMRGLDMLDEICRVEPALVVQLASAIDRYRYQCGRDQEDSDFDYDLAQVRAVKGLLALPWVRYSELRKKLLAFCLQEGFTTSALVEMIGEFGHCQPIAGNQNLTSRVTADASLRCVLGARQAFFA